MACLVLTFLGACTSTTEISYPGLGLIRPSKTDALSCETARQIIINNETIEHSRK